MSQDAARPLDPELVTQVRDWIDDDPDPATRDELTELLDAAGSLGPQGDSARAELLDAFDGRLEFGTAGLRGRIAAGPNRMNRAVVIRAAAGLTAYLKDTVGDEPTVVIGYDARHRSDDFARDTAAVVTAAGGRALVLPAPLPTPVLAFAIRHLGADAGVMVTASHNPPQDNGYKVYLGDGSQIVPPADHEISQRIDAVLSVHDVPLAESGWTTLGDDLVEAYLDAVCRVVQPDSPRDLRVVHTALHGVGSETFAAAMTRVGFPAPLTVASQERPDADFPTVAFPNPEEPGAIDAALELARESGADLVIASDPDADRCAAAICDHGQWRMLRGDEVGVLLGAHLLIKLAHGELAVPEGGPVLANSIVSSRFLSALCNAVDVAHEETLTGFKWISRVPGLVYGFEEALGYCVAPGTVRDKDGISAGLLLAEQAATLKSMDRTLLDVLDDLARQYGLHETDAFSVRVDDLSIIDTIMGRLRSTPPTHVAGVTVRHLDDLALGDGGLPPTEGLRWFLDDDSRIIVRPSGTEPKLKIYLEVVEPVHGPAQPGWPDDDLPAARKRAAKRLKAIRSAFEELTLP